MKISESSSIHPTVVIEGEVEIGPSVEIGPFCLIKGPVKIGERSILASHCVIQGPVEIGKNNRINPHCIIGTEPESRGQQSSGKIRIGDGNILTEQSVITHGTTPEGTQVGNHNYFLSNVHISHDCVLGNNITVAHNVVLGGNVLIQDGATIGIATAIHQNSTIGAYSMIGMNSVVTKDVPPFALVLGNPIKFKKWNSYQLEKLGMAEFPSGELYEQYLSEFHSISKRDILHMPEVVQKNTND